MLEFWEIGSRLHGVVPRGRGRPADCNLAVWEDSLALLWIRVAQGLALSGRTCLRICILQRACNPMSSPRPVVLNAARRVRAAPVVKMG